jgi:hypothetical protein
VNGEKLEITIVGEMPDQIVVKLSGIRKGFGNKRFEKFSHDQMVANNTFWDGWKS